jgi:hypothetical protein
MVVSLLIGSAFTHTYFLSAWDHLIPTELFGEQWSSKFNGSLPAELI